MGGTNPSLLEALGSTQLNLLLDVGFNREVGEDAALYWTKESSNLAELVNRVDKFDELERNQYGNLAKERIRSTYNWKLIGDRYLSVFYD